MAESLEREACQQPLNRRGKLVVLHVHEHHRRIHSSLNETDLEKLTSQATGISVSSVQRFKREAKEGSVSSPPSKRPRISPVVDSMDAFDIACLLRIVASFYEGGDVPTLDMILAKVKEEINFEGSRSSLYRLMRKTGYTLKKTDKGRKILMERRDIALARSVYLRKIQENRESINPRQEIYIDETWVNQNKSVNKCLTSADGKLGPKVKSGRGSRFIIIHAGGEDGFVRGGLKMFKSQNGNKGDYHGTMNHQNFKAWFESQLITNIPPHSLLILDNASYHSKILDKAPTQASRKNYIIEWLRINNVEHDEQQTKLELLHLVEKKKKDKQEYERDTIARAHGHEVLRLPPYHCDLNPIELIWAQVKH